MASRRPRALKLQVPWRDEPLPVQYRGIDGVNGVISDIVASGSPHVCLVGEDVLVVGFFGECNRVPDVSRYHIYNDGKIIRHCDIPESRLQIQSQLRSIVLLVESPSVDEYQFGNINCPIVPANGETGKNLHQCLGKVLKEIKADFDEGLDEDTLIEEGRIESKLMMSGGHVIVSNPIQFQTNLRSIHGSKSKGKWETLRDKVWEALWNEREGEVPGYIQLCLRARLNTYRPSLIINACTQNVKSHVECFVQREFPKVPLYEVYHPSDTRWKGCLKTSWISREKIGLQRRYPCPNAANQ